MGYFEIRNLSGYFLLKVTFNLFFFLTSLFKKNKVKNYVPWQGARGIWALRLAVSVSVIASTTQALSMVLLSLSP